MTFHMKSVLALIVVTITGSALSAVTPTRTSTQTCVNSFSTCVATIGAHADYCGKHYRNIRSLTRSQY